MTIGTAEAAGMALHLKIAAAFAAGAVSGFVVALIFLM